MLEQDNPKLTTKQLSNGLIHLYLEFYLGRDSERVYNEHGEPVFYANGLPKYKIKHKRKKELLDGLFLYSKPKTKEERHHNRETEAKARAVRDEAERVFKKDKVSYMLESQKKINLFDFWDSFINDVKVKDVRLLKGALNNFKRFLAEKYPQFCEHIEAKNLSKEMMQKFAHFLADNHKGEGIETYYNRFKRLINYAIEKDIISKSPCKVISVPKASDMLQKDVLSMEELQQLFATHYKGENPEIRRAFAMTCYSGIRRCDIVRLTYKDVDYANKTLSFRQSKTEGSSGKSGVTILLNDTLLAIIGKQKPDSTDDFIFHLPIEQMCLKALRNWTKKAGIEKHITWHCGRHSFATILLTNGTNIKVVGDLLGHSTLKFTEKYVRALDSEKLKAVNTLPALDGDNI